jgi:DNA-binding NarL/FixJ family response regulator
MDSIRVVIIEDNNLTRVGMRYSLQEQKDIQVIGDADNATTGLELLKSSNADIAIVDIDLPDMNGIELINKFRQVVPTAHHTKIIMLTSFFSEDIVLAAFAAGANSYCVKTIKFDLLVEALRVTYEGQSWIDSTIARIILKNVNSLSIEQSFPVKAKTSSLDDQLLDNSHVEKFTDQELKVLQLIVQGYSNPEIADKLFISLGTVKFHVRNILSKMCVKSRTQAALKAVNFGWVT